MNERVVSEVLEASAEELDDYERRLQRLEEKLELLSEKQREVLVKCVVEGRKYKEVAEEMDISLNTVKTHITRALKFLRDELQDDLVLLFMLGNKAFKYREKIPGNNALLPGK